MISKVCFILILFPGSLLSAQSIAGKWRSVDDVSGKPRSVVEIYKVGNEFFGEVIQIYPNPDEDPDPICDKCTGKKKDQKIIGMEIIEHMVYDPEDQEYDEGQILDPESGSVYDCKMWVGEDGNLRVRGYLFFLYRTQTWLPFDE